MKKLVGGVLFILVVGAILAKNIGVFPVIVAVGIAGGIAWQIRAMRKYEEKNRKLLAHGKRITTVIGTGHTTATAILKKIEEENTPATWENLHARFVRVDTYYTNSKLSEAISLMELNSFWMSRKVHGLLNEFIRETSDYLALFGEIRNFSDKMESLKKEIEKFLISIDGTIASMQETTNSLSIESQKEFMHAVKQFEETQKLLAENRQIDRAAASARLREISVMLKKVSEGAYTLPHKVGRSVKNVLPLKRTSL